MKTELVNHA